MDRPIALPRALALQLAYTRDRKGWSQAALAARLGVSKTVVGFWENGRRSPSLAHFLAWIDALDFDLTLTPKQKEGSR